jgi:hypothetical protein
MNSSLIHRRTMSFIRTLEWSLAFQMRDAYSLNASAITSKSALTGVGGRRRALAEAASTFVKWFGRLAVDRCGCVEWLSNC